MTVEAVKSLCAGLHMSKPLFNYSRNCFELNFLSFFFPLFLTIIDIQTILSERANGDEWNTNTFERIRHFWKPVLDRTRLLTFWDVRYLSRVRSWRSWRRQHLKRTIKLVIIFFPFRHRAMFQLHPMSRLWGSLVDVSLTSDTSVSHAMRSRSLYYLISSSETLEIFLKMFFCSKLMKYVSAIDSMFASQLIVLNWNDQLKISSEWNAKMNELLEKKRASVEEMEPNSVFKGKILIRITDDN